MKYNNTSIIVGAVLFVAFLFIAYNLVTGSLLGQAEVQDGDVEKSLSIEAYESARLEKIAEFTKRNLSGEIVEIEAYGIIDPAPSLDTNLLLSTSGWNEVGFGNNSLHIQVPQEGWYVLSSSTDNQIILTTTQDGQPVAGEPGARIVIGEYKRNIEQSLFDWMEDPTIVENEIAPPRNATLQYVTIGESTFLGSVFFEDHTWAAPKSVYAEVNADAIFAGSLEVYNLTADDERLGEYDQVFYTILESLEVK